MKSCYYCGKEICDAAIKCKYCGKHLPKVVPLSPQKKALAVCLGLFVILVVIFIILSQKTISQEPSRPSFVPPKLSTSSVLPPMTNRSLPTIDQFIVEPEPNWRKRFEELKQKELSAFKAPRVGDQISLECRIGGSCSGKITRLGINSIEVDGKNFWASQLLPETCESIFSDVRATSSAMKQIQIERNHYEVCKAKLWKKLGSTTN